MLESRIIVSLTSWKKRINSVYKVIETLKEQTFQPDKIVLYLAEIEFEGKKLPDKLLRLCDEQFEIRWTDNIGSYKKLIPALRDFPNDIIITVDDDIYYDKRLIELLIDGYKKYPNCIQAHRVTTVEYYSNKKINLTLDSKKTFKKPSVLYKITGVGGVLYPPNCFLKDIMDEKLFLKLAPTGDDIWFWAQSILRGHKVNLVEGHLSKLNYIENTQEVGLSQKNDVGGDQSPFYVQLKNILDYYPKLKWILRKETIIRSFFAHK